MAATTPARTPVTVVVGAAGGIGRAVSRRLAEDGHDVVLGDLDAAPLEKLAVEVAEATGRRAWAVPMDLADPTSVDAAAATVRELTPSVQGLAVIAGVLSEANAITEIDPAEWDRVHAVNLRGPYLAARAFVPLLSDGDAAIVNIASWWGRSGHAFFAPYCSSKAGLIVLTQCLADELAPRGIRANTICPGNVDTSMHRKALVDEAAERGISFEEMKDIEWAKIPLGAAGPPSVIADGVSFLLSERASYVTGASLDINGGVLFH